MRLLIETLSPPLAAFTVFALIVMLRRLWSGAPAFQSGDRSKIALVVSHVTPLLLACLAYNTVVRLQLGAAVEIGAVVGVVAALALAVMRYLEAMDVPLSR